MQPELPELIQFGRAICGDLAQAERREWWLANGLGAYAAGNVAQTLSRRYHGLLIAPIEPPLGRRLVCAKADAILHDGDQSYALHSNRWASGAVEPAGHVHIESYTQHGGVACWHFAIGDIQLEQRIWMEPKEHTTYVAWRLLQAVNRPLRLEVALLVNARDHHSQAQPWDFNPVIESDGTHMQVRHPNSFSLHLRSCHGRLNTQHYWVENFSLESERERGLYNIDNHLCVGRLQMDLAGNDHQGLVVSLNEAASPYLGEALRRRQAHDVSQLRRAILFEPAIEQAPAWVRQLVWASDLFIFARPLPEQRDGESVIAGYPWFGDWGRDTMIALPGLTLATGRYDSAQRILDTFARFIDQGMLPNVFPGSGETPEYNTVDAALWYIEAWRAYIEASTNLNSLRNVFPVLESIIDWHIRGTRYSIGADPADGLLRAGEAEVQLTWMDAKLGDWVVTPRTGKAVEINALWYNALCSMQDFALQLGLDGARYTAWAQRVHRHFVRFVRPEGGLYDVLDSPLGDDASLRPNQIFAVSLPHSPLEIEHQTRVVAEVGQHLLTSYGLRSLAPSHADYRPHYQGGVWERDSSYHQGPVWAWLLGHYALAEYRVTGDITLAQSRLAPLGEHLCDAGLGTVSEIFDGAPPHRPRGAPSQAWSVACALEAWLKLERARRASKTKPNLAARTITQLKFTNHEEKLNARL